MYRTFSTLKTLRILSTTSSEIKFVLLNETSSCSDYENLNQVISFGPYNHIFNKLTLSIVIPFLGISAGLKR